MKYLLRIITFALAIGAATEAVAEFSNSEETELQGKSVIGTRERLQAYVEVEIDQLENGSSALNKNDEQMLKVLRRMQSWLAAKSGSGPGP